MTITKEEQIQHLAKVLADAQALVLSASHQVQALVQRNPDIELHLEELPEPVRQAVESWSQWSDRVGGDWCPMDSNRRDALEQWLRSDERKHKGRP